MTTRQATVQNAHGIHCRPSSVIMNAVKGYEGDIQVSAETGNSNLKSIYDLLCLGLQQGQAVTITVDGPDEKAVADKLVELFETHFDFPPREA